MNNLEHKLLEWKLILNKELYDENVIDLNIYTIMENKLLNKLNR